VKDLSTTSSKKLEAHIFINMATREWSPLDVVWEANDTDFQNGIAHSRLAPSWQILLLGDGYIQFIDIKNHI
jgi:hypothetical protein